LAQTFEEVEGVDALLVGEIDNGVEAVVLEELERGVHLVRAEAERVGVAGGGGVELVAAADVAVHDGGPPQRGGGLGRGVAGLDDEPEQRRVDEAQRVAQPAEVVRLRGARARGRDDDEQLVVVHVVVVVVVEADDGELVAGDDGGAGGRRAEVRGLAGEVGEEVEEAEERAEEEEGREPRERAAREEEEGVRVAAGEVVVGAWRGGCRGVAERRGGRGGRGEGVVVTQQVLLGGRVRPADRRHYCLIGGGCLDWWWWWEGNRKGRRDQQQVGRELGRSNPGANGGGWMLKSAGVGLRSESDGGGAEREIEREVRSGLVAWGWGTVGL
jgi:hypothetical protein